MPDPRPSAPLVSGPGPGPTLAVLAMAAMTIMANATISPSLPGLREHFADVPHIDTLAGLLLTLPSLAILACAGPVGWLADRWDRTWLMLVAGTLYAVGGTSGLWAGSLPVMLAGRLVLGMGVAGTMILATTWAADLWQGEARQTFLGRQGAFSSGSGVVLITLGGLLATLSWRGAFLAYLLVVPVTLLALVMLAPFERARRAERAARPAGPAAGGPGIPWRAFAFIGPLGFLFMAIFYLIPTRLPFRLAELGVDSPALTGLVMALNTLVSIPGALSYRRIRRHLGVMEVFALAWTLMGAGVALIAVAPTLWVAVLGVCVMGSGLGISLPNYTTYWMGVVPPAVRGRASGLLTMAFFSGQFASPMITAPLVGALGLGHAFGVMALAMVALGVGLGGLALSGEGRGAPIPA